MASTDRGAVAGSGAPTVIRSSRSGRLVTQTQQRLAAQIVQKIDQQARRPQDPAIVRIAKAVSYTHLDVYKRQDYVKAQVSISLEAQAVLYGQERQVVDVGPFYYLYVEHLQRASDGHLPLTERVVESVLESWSLDRQLRPSAHLTAELKLDDDSSFRVFSKKKGAEDGPAHELSLIHI